ncbi:MAG: hypothetical protein IPF43_05245 [Arcobacter sp.]|mgnify:FL=1|nr:hypothetical protein [Arcobacter sp.]
MLVEIAQYIVINLSVAFILGLVLGYVIGKGNKEKFNAIQNSTNTNTNFVEKNKIKINPIFNKSASLDFKPMVLSTSNKKDNLKKIKSIDEDIENELFKLGIYHFEQISIWSSKNAEWIENFLNLPNYVRANQWVEQAKILKTGRETNYSQKLLDEENEDNEDLNTKASTQDN